MNDTFTNKITSFFLTKGFSYADSSDFAFLILFGVIIAVIITFLRICFSLYRNPFEWDNIQWGGLFKYLFSIFFTILIIYIIAHFIIKYW